MGTPGRQQLPHRSVVGHGDMTGDGSLPDPGGEYSVPTMSTKSEKGMELNYTMQPSTDIPIVNTHHSSPSTLEPRLAVTHFCYF